MLISWNRSVKMKEQIPICSAWRSGSKDRSPFTLSDPTTFLFLLSYQLMLFLYPWVDFEFPRIIMQRIISPVVRQTGRIISSKISGTTFLPFSFFTYSFQLQLLWVNNHQYLVYHTNMIGLLKHHLHHQVVFLE